MHTKLLIIHESERITRELIEFIKTELAKPIIKTASHRGEVESILGEQQFDIILTSLPKQRIEYLVDSPTRIIQLSIEDSPHEGQIQNGESGEAETNIYQHPQQRHPSPGANRQEGTARCHPPSTIVSLESIHEKISGKIQFISPFGFVCDLDPTGKGGETLSKHEATIEFPLEYDKFNLKKVTCDCLSIQLNTPNKTVATQKLRTVWLFTKRDQQTKETLSQLIDKVNGTHKRLKWNANRLECRLGKYTYLFYYKHLVRIGLILLMILGLIGFGLSTIISEKASLVWQNTTVWQKSSNLLPATAIKKGEYPTDSLFNTEKLGEETLNHLTSRNDLLKALKREAAVIRFNKNEVAILSRGSSIKRVEKEGVTQYLMNGVIQLILSDISPSQKTRIFSINGLNIGMGNARLFFQNIITPPELFVPSGELSLQPNQRKFISISEGIEPKDNTIKLDSGKVVYLEPTKIIITKQTRKPDDLLSETYLPGFDVAGKFNHIGYVTTTGDQFLLNRQGKEYQVKNRVIPIMEGDRVKNNSNQKLLLTLKSKDLAFIYPKSEVTINAYETDETMFLPPLIIGARADGHKPPENRFEYRGRIRMRFITGKRRRIRLKSANAAVETRGTEFEVTSIDEKTEVLIMEGSVLLSQADFSDGVTINKGLMSEVVNGNPPSKPHKIPRNRLLNLLYDSFDDNEHLKLSSFVDLNLDRLEISEKKTLSMIWNKPLTTAEITLNQRRVPLKINKNEYEIVISKELFPNIRPDIYPVTIKAVSQQGEKSKIHARLVVLPDERLRFLCGNIKKKFTSGEIKAIKGFQVKTQIKVDGIVGPQTLGKIREILGCRPTY